MKKLAAVAFAGLLLLTLFVDIVSVGGLGAGYWIGKICSLAIAAAALVLAFRRDALPRAVLMRAALALALVSLSFTLILLLVRKDALYGLLETLGLVILVAVISRRWTGFHETVPLVLLVTAAIAVAWRSSDSDTSSQMFASTVASVVALGIGWGLRENDLTTERRLLGIRNEERQDIARDLHDDVAHHVTGIIVAAQAAAVVAGSDPKAAKSALDRIEHAGIEALESMRSIVSVLRSPDQDDQIQRTAHHTAARWPDDLQLLLERFEHTTGLTTTLTITATHVPPVYRRAVQRVTQEALTNVSRHAQNATRTDVVITQDDRGFHITVTDDGRTSPTGRNALSASGGGFGLLGVKERATALGGQVQAGPQEPGGWRVFVTLPLAETPLPKRVLT